MRLFDIGENKLSHTKEGRTNHSKEKPGTGTGSVVVESPFLHVALSRRVVNGVSDSTSKEH